MNKKLLLILVVASILALAPISNTHAIKNSEKMVEPKQEADLVILTPHWHGIYDVYVDAFKSYWKDKTGQDIEISVMERDTSECLRLVREWAGSPEADVWWGGGLDAFMIAESEDLLASFYNSSDPEWVAINDSIPAELFGLPLKDLSDEHGKYTWWGSALSGFGIMYNKLYLQQHGLPEPKDWIDLANPVYKGHITLTPPSKSGSNHMIVEIILQAYGWEEGWSIITKIAANVREYQEKSYHVPGLVGEGEYGIAPVIDFYAFGQIADKGPDVIGFIYPPGGNGSHTVINPDSIAILKNAPHPDLAYEFMNLVLSYDGQKLLFQSPINRLPVRPDVYAEAPEGYFNPFEANLTLMSYDSDLGSNRWEIVNNLFDVLLVNRHSELVSAWSGILSANATLNDAARAGYDVSTGREKLKEALSYLTAMPVDEAWVSENYEEFNENETFREIVIAEWDAFAVSKYKNASDLAWEASTTIASYVIEHLKNVAQQNLWLGLGGGFVLGLIIGAVVVGLYYRRKWQVAATE